MTEYSQDEYLQEICDEIATLQLNVTDWVKQRDVELLMIKRKDKLTSDEAKDLDGRSFLIKQYRTSLTDRCNELLGRAGALSQEQRKLVEAEKKKLELKPSNV